VEVREWKFANRPPAEIQVSNLPKPDWTLDIGYWKVEGGSLTTRLLKFKSQISSTPLFRKRGFLFGSPCQRQAGPLARKGEFLFKKKTTIFSLFLKREGEALA